jgi:predicted metal-dependent phosphotriesterase family hydrolase
MTDDKLFQGIIDIHAYAWRERLTGIRENGVTQAEIDRMTKTNPARLLGIDRENMWPNIHS